MESLQVYLDSKLLILIPVLLLIGKMLKTTEKVKDKYIPVFLGITGIILAGCYQMGEFRSGNIETIFIMIFYSVTQGVIAAGLAVYGHQVYTQLAKEE